MYKKEKYRYILLFLVGIFLNIPAIFANISYEDIEEIASINRSGAIIGYFLSLGDCAKCSDGFAREMTEVESLYSHKNVEPIALVRCNRKAEMKMMLKDSGWNMKGLVDLGNSRETLKLKPTTLTFIYFPSKNRIVEFGIEDTHKISDELKKYLKL